MKIEPNRNINYYTHQMDLKRQGSAPSAPRSTASNFDGITIKSEQTISPEKVFADTLSARLSLEVKKPVSSLKIQDLQQRIAKGTYEVDINSITDKIMLY